jgi:hypothetical protein
MSTPVDEKLYESTKKEVDKIYDKPSAYRSMAYTRFYLRAFREKYGQKKSAYKGKRPGDLEKWRREKWVDVRSYLDTPKNPIACGGVEYGKKEYPLCMPESKAKSYTKEELSALLYRKGELGKTRLVKEPYLRDLYGEPLEEVKVKDIKPLKEPKMRKEPRQVKEAKPKKVRKVVEAEVAVDEPVEKEPVQRKARGRPKKVRSEEQIKTEQLKQESLQRRREARAGRMAEQKRNKEERTKRQQERAATEPRLPSGLQEGSIMRTPFTGTLSFD